MARGSASTRHSRERAFWEKSKLAASQADQAPLSSPTPLVGQVADWSQSSAFGYTGSDFIEIDDNPGYECACLHHYVTLKGARPNASQSFCDASFIVEGETDRFVDRTSVFERNRENPADRESEWPQISKNGGSDESPATHAEMPPL